MSFSRFTSTVSRRAFTLVELLVVIAVIAVLVLLLLPAINAARESARMSNCKNNLRQIGIALHNHHGAKNVLPPGWVSREADEPDGEPGWGWAVELLPYLEEKELYSKVFDRKLPVDDPANQRGRETSLSVFMCPSDGTSELVALHEGDGHDHSHHEEHEEGEEHEEEHEHEEEAEGPYLLSAARANYVGVFGTQEIHDDPAQGNGVLYLNSRTRFRDIKDGLSKTIFAGERSSKLGASVWVGVVHGADANMERVVGSADHPPNAPQGHFDDFSSHHPTGAHFVMGDGGVRLITDDVDELVYQSLATRKGGEQVGSDFGD
jgi:prepilin-type N-terminal cleavage/methylation domain-containing protein